MRDLSQDCQEILNILEMFTCLLFQTLPEVYDQGSGQHPGTVPSDDLHRLVESVNKDSHKFRLVHVLAVEMLTRTLNLQPSIFPTQKTTARSIESWIMISYAAGPSEETPTRRRYAYKSS